MHPTRRYVFAGVFATLAMFAGLPDASAAPDKEEAGKVVTAFAKDIWQTLESKDLADSERADRLAATIAANIDAVLLGRLALGRHWRQLSDEQKQRYDAVFPDFIASLLAARLISATGEVEGSFEEMFKVLDGKQVGDDDIVVQTEILATGSQQPVTVDWRLRQNEDKLAIIDLAINQVSLLISQRNEFAAVIERGSAEDLLNQLEKNAGA